MLSFLALSISDIRIRRHILGDVFYSTFTNDFYYCHVFTSFSGYNCYLNVFYMHGGV